MGYLFITSIVLSRSPVEMVHVMSPSKTLRVPAAHLLSRWKSPNPRGQVTMNAIQPKTLNWAESPKEKCAL